MNSPFTAEPLEAYMAAQTAVGATLTAIALHKPMQNRIGTALLVFAIWLAVVAPIEGNFLHGLGINVLVGSDRLVYVLRVATVIATISTLFSGRIPLVAIGVVGELILYWLAGSVLESDWEVASLHLAFFGLLVGASARARTPPAAVAEAPEPELAQPIDDSISSASPSCSRRSCASSSSIARRTARTSGRTRIKPPCSRAAARTRRRRRAGPRSRIFGSSKQAEETFRNTRPAGRSSWRRSSRFAWCGSRGRWRSGCSSWALRASRARATAGHAAGTMPPPRSQVRAAGWFAAFATMLSATMLINGGSRFPHVFVGATFAWALEWLCEMTTPGLDHDRQWRTGLWCGAAAMMTASTRPPDGMTLGIGMLLYAIYALARRRLPWRAIVGTLVSFAVVAGFTLVILRFQLGKWFATGYSLNDTFHPWNKFGYSMPAWSELKAALPLGTGAYCWWPCSPAVGIAGMAMLHGRARRIAVVMFLSSIAFVCFYEAIEFGRHLNFGYGPRFQLPLVVPMAVGTGIALAPLWQTARARFSNASALRTGGPVAIAIAAALIGVVRIAPLLYPYTYSSVMMHDALHEALLPMHFRNAIVFGSRGLNNTDMRDLTENLPLDLYPNQSVIVANDFTPSLRRCVEDAYPNRTLYRAVPGPPIHFQQLPR